jgi:glycosyltransferase involved in cell wall biosynthesis
MKIIQTNKAYHPLIGGVETIVANLSEGLIKRDAVDVEVLVCNNVISLRKQQRTINGVQVTYLPMWTKIASLPISPSYPVVLSRLYGDILHIHEPFPLADLSILSIPSIRKRFSRIVVTWHSDIVRQKWALSVYSSIIHKFLKKVDRIIVATPNHIDSSLYLRNYIDKCEVIPFGLQLDWVHERNGRDEKVQKIKHCYGGPLLLFVGRLVYYKGLKYLISAMRLLPDAKLVIIGSGPLQATLQKQIADLQLDKRVVILSNIPDTELHAFYEACDVFVLPSTEMSEAFGLVQVEAMACGKPVVSTNLNTGVSFVNQNGITGLTVRPRDPEGLSEAIQKLIDDTRLRYSLGRNAKERALQEFTIEKMIERTMNLYNRILL